MTPELYTAKLPTFETVLWDGSEKRAVELDAWVGNGWWTVDEAGIGRLWDPVERAVVAVEVGARVAKDGARAVFVITAEDLAAGYDAVPAGPSPAPDPAADPAPAPAPGSGSG